MNNTCIHLTFLMYCSVRVCTLCDLSNYSTGTLNPPVPIPGWLPGPKISYYWSGIPVGREWFSLCPEWAEISCGEKRE